MKATTQIKKSAAYSNMPPPFLRKAISALKSKLKSFSLIDVGCGHGNFLFPLQKEGFLKEVKVVGLDIDKKALSEFKKRVPHAQTICIDASDLRMLKNGSFDLVICNQVIEHVENDNKLLLEINRILKNEGILYISSVLKKWYGLYWHRNKFGEIVVDPTHLREYSSPAEFSNLLTKNDFLIKNLNIHPGRLPLAEYFLLILAKFGILKFADVRDYYLNHPKVYQLSNLLLLPLPGYAIIEVLAKKEKK